MVVTPPTTREPPEDEPDSQSVKPTDYGSDFLLVKDCNPWFEPANERALAELDQSYGIVNSDGFADRDLAPYHTIIIPSTQTQAYYDNLVQASDKLTQFVSDGGRLIAHVTDFGYPCTTQWSTPFLPQDVTKENTFEDDLTLVEGEHPIYDGIQGADLDGWFYSTHGYLADIPDDRNVLVTVAGTDEQQPTYVVYSHGDGIVLATMQTVEWPWGLGSDNVPDVEAAKDLLRNELKYALEQRRTEVSTDIDVLSFIPGESENITRRGDPLDSSVSQFLPEGFTIRETVEVFGGEYGIELETSPLFDNWGTGDMILTENYPSDIDIALLEELEKYEEDGGRDGPKFRTRNTVNISFETLDGEHINPSTIEVDFIGVNSQSVLEQEDINNLDDELVGDGSSALPGGYRDRYYTVDEDVTIDGVDAVRVATIFGGYTRVADGALELLREKGPFEFLTDVLDWDPVIVGADLPDEFVLSHLSGLISGIVDALVAVPNIYTFLEIYLTADGRRYIRMWDNSMFPEHAVYVDGINEHIVSFPKETDSIRRLLHINFAAFLLEATVGITPYYGSKRLYLNCVVNPENCLALVEDELDTLVKNHPLIDSDDLKNYDELLPLPGTPVWQFALDRPNGRDAIELSDEQINTDLPADPLNPFVHRLSHDPNES